MRGVIHAPFSNQLYHAVRGGGAFMNGQPIQVSSVGFGQQAKANVDWWYGSKWDVMRPIHRLAYDQGLYVIAPGSTTHAAALVARGELVASVFVGAEGKNVDVAAAKVIVEEAGGRVTDLFGEEQRYDQDIRGFVATNGVVHDEFIAALKDAVQ